MRGIMVLGAAAFVMAAAGPARADCAAELEAVMAEAPEIKQLPSDQQMLARRTLRDLRAAAHRLDSDGLQAACMATVDALADVMTGYHLAVQEGAPAGSIMGAEDDSTEDASLDRRDERLVPLSAADMAFATRDVIGNTVYNHEGEAVGEFAGVLTAPGGFATHALIKHGDFWAILGGKAAIPVDLVRWDRQHALFYVPLSEEQLESAPEYEEDAWEPEINDRYYAGLD